MNLRSGLYLSRGEGVAVALAAVAAFHLSYSFGPAAFVMVVFMACLFALKTERSLC
jgi:hypothetical protein